MRLKRILMWAPLILILVLFQSYFWVPTYEKQTTGNPERVRTFIESSIGDAKILNPILNADSASSRIAGLVFEGLLDMDENLQLRGRLAKDWTISETAYLLVNPKARFPDGSAVSAEALETRIKAAIASGRISGVKDMLKDVRRLPPETRTEQLELLGPDGKPLSLTLRLSLPERIQFSLARVDQDFFTRLEPVIGKDYARSAPIAQWVDVQPADQRPLVEPMLGEILPVFEHNPVIVFNLRDDVYFHDGHPFDAGDVKFTYEAIMNPRNISPRSSDFEPIKRVEVLGPHSIRLVYRRLFSPAINAWTIGILPEHLLNEAAMKAEMERRKLSPQARAAFGMRDSEFNRRPIGAGAFRFEEWQGDEYIRLSRFDRYWDRLAQFREFYYRVIPDPVTQEVEFRTGAIDTYSPQPYQAARYKQDETYQSYSSLSFGYTFIGYNTRRPLFADKRVRRALSMAINTDDIIKYVIYGEGERITGPFPKNTQWYDSSVAPIPYDPEGALRILNELGWKKNAQGWLEKDGKVLEFNLITNNGNLVRKAIMTIAQNSWRKIGIKCNTQLFEWAVFLQDFINPGEFDALILSWSMGIDPDLYQIWHSSQTGPNMLNFAGYKSPQADELIVRIRQEYDENKQRALAHQLHRLIAEDQPYTFLYASLSTLVLDKKIVMINDDGTYGKLKPTKTGSVFYYFDRWKKLEHQPQFGVME